MTDCNSVNILIKIRCFIDMQEPKDYKEVKIKPYQQLIGKLMYLLCGTRPDIFFAVRQLNKYNADLQIGHMKAAKKVICYLKNIMHLGLIYNGNLKYEGKAKVLITPSLFGLIRYENSSYARDPEDRKFVMGYYYFINRAIIS